MNNNQQQTRTVSTNRGSHLRTINKSEKQQFNTHRPIEEGAIDAMYKVPQEIGPLPTEAILQLGLSYF